MGRKRSTTIGRNPLDSLGAHASPSCAGGPLEVLLGAAGSAGTVAGGAPTKTVPEPTLHVCEPDQGRAAADGGHPPRRPAEPEADGWNAVSSLPVEQREQLKGPLPGEYLTLRAGGETFGVALAEVREILVDRPVSRLPHVPSFVLGLVNVRGRVVPLLDLARRLGLPPRRGDGRGVIVLVEVDVGERVAVGLLVDDVLTVVSQASAQLGPPPAASRSTFLAGIGRCGDELLRLLDVCAVVGDEPLQRRIAAVPERSCRS
jgi:purine-binding chemotaxis protein CheW